MNKLQDATDSIKAAIKACSLSLIALEIGMFGGMDIVHFIIFAVPPQPNEPEYWFIMQIAMVLGFLTSYPANWWLVRNGM